MNNKLNLRVLILLLTLCGAANGSATPDSATSDSVVVDSGAIDSGAIDSGAIDSGTMDSENTNSASINSKTIPNPEKTNELFNKMKSLVGVWTKQGDKQPKLKIAFELTANDTVLIETWLYQGKKHSLTIYHKDKGELIATHYCPQGNQPRLRMNSASDLNDISFKFFDATNLASLDDSHQHSLSFEFGKTGQIIKRKESYLSKAGEEFSELILIRH